MALTFKENSHKQSFLPKSASHIEPAKMDTCLSSPLLLSPYILLQLKKEKMAGLVHDDDDDV